MQPEKLLAAVEKFLQHFKDAWGCAWMIPKFHWLLHFHDQMSKSKFLKLLNCFCLERKHRVPKRSATEITNTVNKNSKSLLMEVTSHHIGQLSRHDAFAFEVGLVGGSKASRRIQQLLTAELELDGEAAESIQCSRESRFNPLATCMSGDIVLFNDGMGGFKVAKVELHCEVHGVPITMVSVYDLHKLESDCGYSVWKCAPDQARFIATDKVLDTVVHSELSDGKLAVLLPLEFR